MFYGEHEASVDDKGRVIIPSKLRDAAREDEEGAGFVMTLGEDGCVTLYTPRRWRELEEELSHATRNTKGVRRRRRFVFSQAETGTCDRQGRLRVPARLLAAAEISREVVVVGVSDQIEVWDKARWQAFKTEMLAERESDAENFPQ